MNFDDATGFLMKFKLWKLYFNGVGAVCDIINSV